MSQTALLLDRFFSSRLDLKKKSSPHLFILIYIQSSPRSTLRSKRTEKCLQRLISKTSSILPFKWPEASPNASQNQSHCNATVKTLPRTYALGATTFPQKWNSSSNRPATRTCTELYYRRFPSCSASSVRRPPASSYQNKTNKTDHSNKITQHRPTHLDRSRTRRPAIPRHHVPHPRRGAKDQERVPLHQEIHGRSRRVAETEERPRAPRHSIQSDV